MGQIAAELSPRTILLPHSASRFLLMVMLLKGINAKHNVLIVYLALARALCGH
jgi:hypothetical protein